MLRIMLPIMVLAVIAGYFGLGTLIRSPGAALATLFAVFLAALVGTFLYESYSRRRWVI